MKLKEGYLLREVAGNNVVVPTGAATLDFLGVITLNGTAKFLWELLMTEKSEEELVCAFLGEYEVDEATARADLREFLEKLRAANLLE